MAVLTVLITYPSIQIKVFYFSLLKKTKVTIVVKTERNKFKLAGCVAIKFPEQPFYVGGLITSLFNRKIPLIIC